MFESAYSSDPERPAANEGALLLELIVTCFSSLRIVMLSGKLRVPSVHPWNSEPADLSVLVDSFYTPNDLFFVRNHNAVPVIEEKDYRLEIEANATCGIEERTFTLEELKTKFPRHEVCFVTRRARPGCIHLC